MGEVGFVGELLPPPAQPDIATTAATNRNLVMKSSDAHADYCGHSAIRSLVSPPLGSVNATIVKSAPPPIRKGNHDERLAIGLAECHSHRCRGGCRKGHWRGPRRVATHRFTVAQRPGDDIVSQLA